MTRTYDCIVLGAGVYGLATARQLASDGRSVLVLDRSPVGREASGYALGRLDPLLGGIGSAHRPGAEVDKGLLTKRSAEAQLGLAGYNRHLSEYEDICAVSGIDYQLDHQPTLQLCDTPELRAAAEASLEEWNAAGFKSEALEPSDIKRLDKRINAPEFGGVLVYGPVFIDSLKFVLALAECAKSAGATLVQTQVDGLEFGGGSTKVITGDGGHSAQDVVVAFGPWTRTFLEGAGVDVPIYPSKGEILRMTPPEGGPLGVHVHGPCSLVNKRDGLFWVAATARDEEFDRTPTDWARQKLVANALQMIPAMSGSEISQHTVCFRPATPDGLPILGRVPVAGNVLVASGGGGSGIMQCLEIGRQAAAMVKNGKPEPESPEISPARFAPDGSSPSA
ncbi:MAG: FAD-dependent oxidoreductase [Dehalococcoidia bacterium]